jgi:hypothetical protein
VLVHIVCDNTKHIQVVLALPGIRPECYATLSCTKVVDKVDNQWLDGLVGANYPFASCLVGLWYRLFRIGLRYRSSRRKRLETVSFKDTPSLTT